MGDYGIHPTRYGALGNNELYSMYRSAIFDNLNEDEKLDLLQETVNRDALEMGELGTPLVQFSSLPAEISGNTIDGIIQLSYDMAVRGIQSFNYNGQTMEHSLDDNNIQSLNTVLHENVHAWQDQLIDGTILTSDDQLLAEYRANDFTHSTVSQNENNCLGSQYLMGDTPGGYYFYYFQATERDAYQQAEQKTESILQNIIDNHGSEKSFETYAKGTEINGYQAMEQKAMEFFNDSNFVADVNQVLMNQFFGTEVPVDANVEAALKTEMIATYQAMNSLSNTEENNMGFDPEPVSLEQYNQTLRGAVNDFYQHAMDDSSMNTEDAFRTASEMAERYFEAVEEFQDEMSTEKSTETVEENNVIGTEEVEQGEIVGTENTGISIDDNFDINEATTIDSNCEECDGGIDF
jgi:hypothetical protein